MCQWKFLVLRYSAKTSASKGRNASEIFTTASAPRSVGTSAVTPCPCFPFLTFVQLICLVASKFLQNHVPQIAHFLMNADGRRVIRKCRSLLQLREEFFGFGLRIRLLSGKFGQ